MIYLFQWTKRRRWWLLAVLLAVAGAVFAFIRKPPNLDDRYRTVVLERGNIQQVISATGTLQPTAQVNVGTQVSGTIARVYVDFNQSVKAGQVLAEMDPALFRSSVKQAQASLASAEAQMTLARSIEERNRSLVEQKFIARQQMDSATLQREVAQAAVEVARAQLERAQTDLTNSVIRTPVDGVVIDRKIDVGQTVAASFQTPNLFVIARDLSEMEIHANVSEADVGVVRKEMPVQFRVDAHFDRRFEGKVRQIRLNPKSEQGVVTYNVIITTDNRERLLLPGMTARVDIVSAKRDDVLKLSNPALRFRPAEARDGKSTAASDIKYIDADKTANGRAERDRTPRVYRLYDGNVTLIEVNTGITDGRFTELISAIGHPEGGPLQVGDKLVIRDMQVRQAGEVTLPF